MDARPLVSIIVPAYNAQEFIAETLDSILAQTYENLEIIVVDDGSTDQTSKIVQGYGSRVLYCSQSNSGGCAVPRNTGIEHSSGDFLCFMDADDLMTTDRIARQVDFMERNPHVGLVFSDYRNFNEDCFYSKSHFQTCPRLWPQLSDQSELVLENPCAHLAQENFGIAGSFLMRKNILKFASLFETTLKSCEDFHFFFRLARYTPVGIINEVGMLRRLHGHNMSGDAARMLREGIRSRTFLRDTEENPGVRKLLNRYIARCQGSLARYHADQGRYVHAMQNDRQALLSDFCWHQVQATCRNTVRTLLMMMGVHRAGKI